jgi:hypothetical protein
MLHSFPTRRSSDLYVEAFERLTGIPFARYVEDPEVVLA